MEKLLPSKTVTPVNQNCGKCSEEIDSPAFKCEQCKLYIHVGCSSLPSYSAIKYFTSRVHYVCEKCESSVEKYDDLVEWIESLGIATDHQKIISEDQTTKRPDNQITTESALKQLDVVLEAVNEIRQKIHHIIPIRESSVAEKLMYSDVVRSPPPDTVQHVIVKPKDSNQQPSKEAVSAALKTVPITKITTNNTGHLKITLPHLKAKSAALEALSASEDVASSHEVAPTPVNGFKVTVVRVSPLVREVIMQTSALYIENVRCRTYDRPPECPSNLFISSLEEIRIKLNAVSTWLPNIIFTGDFNFPTIDWNSESVIGGGTEYRLQAGSLMEFAREFCLQQFIELPTRGENILDLFFTNYEDIVQEYNVNSWRASDHRLITVKTSIMKYQADKSPSDSGNIGFNALNLFSPLTNWTAIRNELRQVSWDSTEGDQQPETLYEEITRVCLVICTHHSPKRRLNKKKNDIPKDRRIIMRKRAAVRKKFKDTKSEHNKRLIEARLERMDQELRESVRRQQQLTEKNAVVAIKTNPKYFYTYAKNNSKLKTDVMALTDADGNLENDPPKLCELFSQQFAGVFNAPLRTMAIDDSGSFFRSGATEHQELSAESNAIDDQLCYLRTNGITIPGEEASPCPGSP
ncbi:hypothetical protein Pcinc_011789 [Petrolisthes cinctipes]|uniref:Endonuclease/exonuclease/phosphatase domain-containing protein n=1 Tax=Petrolisthes cinctipes TaxID=88211 RepID=A0AAE1G0D1_PETCI|nr:hypothetical protein Pcinc_011789 [Petrolisthes cinctipes]